MVVFGVIGRGRVTYMVEDVAETSASVNARGSHNDRDHSGQNQSDHSLGLHLGDVCKNEISKVFWLRARRLDWSTRDGDDG